ncbi:hypothetical protein [Blastococcus sp. LR1]|uniref:hypothetical protein n=1 Tax=Blastococcus sp. LR1 TaxID=2877000 RepID=UPI001CCB6F53|nr:hypothetical protein [Blastococcus sp. LR1]MCA0145598.1 hypothetical protein [Blastococcus sp. LR1]
MSDPREPAESLEGASARFATDIEDTLVGVLPGSHRIVSRRAPDLERYVVGPEGRHDIPLLVGGEVLATLSLAMFLSLDRSETFLKTVRSDFIVKSTLHRQPLIRLDYRADMDRAPSAHWQFHAERGAFSHLLARAHALDPTRVNMPHDLGSLHIPVGGERFRPCLEDFLQFLIQECGIDRRDGWLRVLEEGRRRWRLRQLAATIRDAQDHTADVLRGLGWAVERTDAVDSEEYRPALVHW